jgi:hypothetical protein
MRFFSRGGAIFDAGAQILQQGVRDAGEQVDAALAEARVKGDGVDDAHCGASATLFGERSRGEERRGVLIRGSGSARS